MLARLQVSPEYGQAEECILKGDGDMGGAFIVRLPAGDPKVYLRCGGRGGATRRGGSAGGQSLQ